MIETLITLKPKSEWPKIDTWYSWRRNLSSPFSDASLPTISPRKLINRMNQALTLPGLANSWTMPIKGRIEMLSTGLRTPVGIKISGADLQVIEDIGIQVESILPGVAGTRSVFAERAGSGYFLNFEWNREELARYNIGIEEARR